jgi:hypothetical protein
MCRKAAGRTWDPPSFADSTAVTFQHEFAVAGAAVPLRREMAAAGVAVTFRREIAVAGDARFFSYSAS